jgi:hypothetical protein
MAGVAVFFKAADGLPVEPKIVELKSSVKSQEDLVSYHFASLDEFKTLLRSQLSDWLKTLYAEAFNATVGTLLM